MCPVATQENAVVQRQKRFVTALILAVISVSIIASAAVGSAALAVSIQNKNDISGI